MKEKTRIKIYWGVIGIGLFFLFSDYLFPESKEDQSNLIVANETFIDMIDLNIAKTPSIAKTNYLDPFLKPGFVVTNQSFTNIISTEPSAKTEPKQKQKPVIPESQKQRPKITFKGIIKKEKEHPLGILEINGKTHFMSVGEKIDDITVLFIDDTSIQVKFNEEKLVITTVK